MNGSEGALIEWILSAMGTWGYPIAFFASFLESLAIVGAFTPGDVIVVTTAFAASQGKLSIVLVGLASAMGTILGNNVTYFFFRNKGEGWFLSLARRVEPTRIGRWFKISDETFYGAKRYFALHGSKTIFMARFATGVKGYIVAVAGACHMSLFWFQLYTVISAVVYAAIMCTIGWIVGANIQHAMRIVSGIGWVGLLLFSLFLLVIFATSKMAFNRRRKEKMRELADEGEVCITDVESERLEAAGLEELESLAHASCSHTGRLPAMGGEDTKPPRDAFTPCGLDDR